MVEVRNERPVDVEAIRALHTASFPTPGEAALVDALRSAGRLSISIVAVESEEVVGHVAFSPVTLDGVPVGVGLGPIAVRLECRRRGVGSALVREGLKLCRHAAAPLVVVLGNPRYYSRFGFVAASKLELRDEYAGGAAFQVLEIAPTRVPTTRGLIRYAPEFAALEV